MTSKTHAWPGQTWTIGFDSIFDRLEKQSTQPSGYPPHNVDLNGDKEYIHKGIATRKFDKKFTLGEFIEVQEVALVDGILSVYLEKNIPEEKKPKNFSINSEAQLLTE